MADNLPPGAFIAPAGGGLISGGIYSADDSASSQHFFGQTTYIYWGQSTPSTATPGTVATAAATGVNPTETSYALYGHVVPLLVPGRVRVGGDIISGPDISGGNAYGINSFGVQADPTRILTLIEIAFDSEVVWTGTCVGDASAAVTPAASGFTTEPFTVRFYTGSLDQPADPLETVPYGANAVGYIGQVLLAIDGLPLANTKFKKYPYISARFVDQDGEAINFGEAFTRLALSPYVGLTADQFETVDITDGVPDGGFIITQDAEFLGLIQQFGRFYRNWDILQTDKLRIVDKGSDVTPDIVLDKSSMTGQVTIARAEPDSIPRELILSTPDPDADYTIVPSKASFPRDAVAVSTSVKTETQYLPVIMDSSTRQAIVTFTKYSEEIARKRVSCTAMITGLEIEPGDLVGFEDLADGISDETFKVKETTTGANLTVEIVAESFMDCQIPTASCATADAFLARTSGLNSLHRSAYSNLICGLVADGVWAKLDIFYVFATQNQAAADLNLISSSFPNSTHGSPAWVADGGYSGVEGSSSVYMSYGVSGFPTPNFSTNNAHGSVWSNSSGQTAGVANGSGGGGGTGSVDIFTRTASNQSLYYMNSMSTHVTAANTDGSGLYVANMDSGTTLTGWKNGVLQGTQSTSAVATWGGTLFILASNAYPGTGAAGTGAQISAASWGGSLTPTDEANFYARLRTYMTAVGVP